MEILGQLIGSLGALLLVLAIPIVLVLAVVWNVTLFRAMKSIVGIREQLERLNQTLESRITVTRTGPLGL
jgi:hypothetical protein